MNLAGTMEGDKMVLAGADCKAQLDDVIHYPLRSSRIEYPGPWFDIFQKLCPDSRIGWPSSCEGLDDLR